MSKFINLTNQQFGKLIVIRRGKNSSSGQTRWICKCECGNTTTVFGSNLKAKRTKSCGCLSKQIATKHGYCGTSIYTIWQNMMKRCHTPTYRDYKYYGGRGIKVCDRWHVFEFFLEDMGERPKGLTIDRINNDGNYCKENCRWSTWRQQTRNNSRNVLITFNNQTMCLKDWCDFMGLKYSTVKERIRRNWLPEEALELVPRK